MEVSKRQELLQFIGTADEDFINKAHSFLMNLKHNHKNKSSEDEIVSCEVISQEPITQKKLQQIVNRAVEDVQSGNYITHEGMIISSFKNQ